MGVVIVSELLGSSGRPCYLIQTARSTFSMHLNFSCYDYARGVLHSVVDFALTRFGRDQFTGVDNHVLAESEVPLSLENGASAPESITALSFWRRLRAFSRALYRWYVIVSVFDNGKEASSKKFAN